MESSVYGDLRGDYSQADEHYVIAQDWAAYTPEQHALWRKLYERQTALLPGRACDEFIDSLTALNMKDGIPHFERISDSLHKATGWRLVPVPGLIPNLDFFEHLAARRFPVTVWLRTPEEFDYIVEPDVFHDFFGHVPLLFNPIVAEHMQQFGLGGLKALQLGGLDNLSRLYWYTIEFGLIKSESGLRAYGAGILSSGGEIEYCLTSTVPLRIAFDAKRIMQTQYKIDSYQEVYFVIRDFQQLLDETAPDFTPIYADLRNIDPLPANSLLHGEVDIRIDNKN